MSQSGGLGDEIARTAKIERIPKPLLPDEFDTGFAPFVKLTRVVHLVCFFVPRTKEMGNAHGSLDILDILSASLCHATIDGSTPVHVFDP